MDDRMETNLENVFAASDVVEAYDLILGAKRPIQLWPLAYRRGLIAGANMAGGKKRYVGGFPINSSRVDNGSFGKASGKGERDRRQKKGFTAHIWVGARRLKNWGNSWGAFPLTGWRVFLINCPFTFWQEDGLVILF